jgi:hypothetical protein
MPAHELAGAKRIGSSLRLTDAGGGRKFVYGVLRGRVSFVALASPRVAASASAVRAYVKRAKLQ